MKKSSSGKLGKSRKKVMLFLKGKCSKKQLQNTQKLNYFVEL
jgi:hypothetical protein